MRWRRIPKENSVQPEAGTYRNWKELLAEEGFHQCVYCAIQESSFGGIRNFHVEHLKPRRLFQERENDFQNLFYACCICNVFKGGDWPGEPDPDFQNLCYPNPAAMDYSDLFRVEKSGVIEPAAVAKRTAHYLIEKLYLNRPQLIIERRLAAIYRDLQSLHEFLQRALSLLREIPGRDEEVRQHLDALMECLLSCNGYLLQLRELRPYDTADVTRQ